MRVYCLIIALLILSACQSIDSFDDCVNAGNPVMESYPRQCRANGQLFVEEIPKTSVGKINKNALREKFSK